MALDSFRPKQPEQEEEGRSGAERWMREMDDKSRGLANSDRTLREYKRFLEASEEGEPYPYDLDDWGIINMYKEARDNGVTLAMWQERSSKYRSASATVETFYESMRNMNTTELLTEYDRIGRELRERYSQFIQVGKTVYGGFSNKNRGIPVAAVSADMRQAGGKYADPGVLRSEADFDSYIAASILTRKRSYIVDALANAGSASLIDSRKEDWGETGGGKAEKVA